MGHNTPATVMSALALVVALGGASYAAVTVGSAQIKNNSVTTKDLKNRTIKDKDLSKKTSARLLKNGTPAGGALAGTYPAPTLAPAALPKAVTPNPLQATDPCATQTLVLCGTAGNYWLPEGFGLSGPVVWTDQLDQVHLRGSLTRVGGPTEILFRLPESMRPKVTLSFPVALGSSAGSGEGSTALLVVTPVGSVGITQRASEQNVVHLGDITFRTDG
jgi:hypothetical protein